MRQNRFQAFGHFRIVADIALNCMHGIVQNFVDRHHYRIVNRGNRLHRRIGSLRIKQFQRVQRHCDIASKGFKKLQILIGKRIDFRTFNIERPHHLVVVNQRHGQRAFRADQTVTVQRIMGCVLAQIALPGRTDKTCHAIVFGLSEKRLHRRFGINAFGQQRFQPTGRAVKQTNFDHVEIQQVVGVVQNVVFEQINPLVNIHLVNLFGTQICQCRARAMQGFHFLLLQNTLRRIRDRHQHSLATVVRRHNRYERHLEIAFAQLKSRRARLFLRPRRRDWSCHRPDDFRISDGLIKILADKV